MHLLIGIEREKNKFIKLINVVLKMKKRLDREVPVCPLTAIELRIFNIWLVQRVS